jgi:hypothetical protein
MSGIVIKMLPFPHILHVVDTITGVKTINGQAKGVYIQVEKSAYNFDAVYHHELEHVKQFYITFGLHGLFYLLSKKYRLWSEVQAYKQSIKHGVSVKDASVGLCNNDVYNLNITFEEAKELLCN